MLSAREGPLFALCCTCQRFGRWSDPMMRTLLPVARLPPLESAFSALVDTLGAVSALTKKTTTESRIQAPMTIAAHLRTRRRRGWPVGATVGTPGRSARRRLRRSSGVAPGRGGRMRSTSAGRDR